MKKYTKLIIFVLALLIVFGIYSIFSKEQSKIYYLPLGDSISEGMNPYLGIDYGYPDYVKDYLDKNNRLSFYTKGFTKSGYTTRNVKSDIENNKTIEVDGKNVHLKEALRESDLVTLTIGANNFLGTISLNNIEEKITNIEATKKEADKIGLEIKELLILIKQYAKKQIIVTGYFNPFPRLIEYKDVIDELVKYFNNVIEETCEEVGVDYVDIFDVLDGNKEALPNPLNIHPNTYGYELISKEVIKAIK